MSSRSDLGLVSSGHLGFANALCVVFPALSLFRFFFFFSASAGGSG
jgi:hypothetical protein